MDNDPIHLLERALEETSRLVSGVQPGQWGLPTPCAEWSVRDLVNHMAAGNRYFAALARDEDVDRSAFAGDNLGESPALTYQDSARELQQALQNPDLLRRTYNLPFGRLPGPAMVALRLVETVTHGWDLARATAQDPDFAPEAVQAALGFSEKVPPPAAPGGPFAPPRQTNPDATDLERLAARLGRQTT